MASLLVVIAKERLQHRVLIFRRLVAQLSTREASSKVHLQADVSCTLKHVLHTSSGSFDLGRAMSVESYATFLKSMGFLFLVLEPCTYDLTEGEGKDGLFPRN